MSHQQQWQQYLFAGLHNLNDGFDAASICYFSEQDFAVVLQRAEKTGVAVFGIEPWLDGDYYDTDVHEHYDLAPDDPAWYWQAFERFRQQEPRLQYAASYGFPKGVPPLHE
ncbi:hypothetical protein L1281_001214 [Neisseria sp. HSC-16F19]|nr:hypothetical protein [Neisseria sp. HSC-16F19]MCP2040631.1 hypothetical protein [Neisseria sp. HSC-16F19]